LALADASDTRLAIIAATCAITFLLSIATIILSWRQPLMDHQPMPVMIKVSFAIFVIALLMAGGQMIFKSNVMPWPVDSRSCVVFGWIFLGAAAGFLYALIFPFWPFAKEQLYGFLVYDIVLIIPYIQHFPNVRPGYQNSLTVYTGVLIFSGALAVYYLLVHRTPGTNNKNPLNAYHVQKLSGGD
jgi:hypothetical protein